MKRYRWWLTIGFVIAAAVLLAFSSIRNATISGTRRNVVYQINKGSAARSVALLKGIQLLKPDAIHAVVSHPATNQVLMSVDEGWMSFVIKAIQLSDF